MYYSVAGSIFFSEKRAECPCSYRVISTTETISNTLAAERRQFLVAPVVNAVVSVPFCDSLSSSILTGYPSPPAKHGVGCYELGIMK